jgi:hypothetical protein
VRRGGKEFTRFGRWRFVAGLNKAMQRFSDILFELIVPASLCRGEWVSARIPRRSLPPAKMLSES